MNGSRSADDRRGGWCRRAGAALTVTLWAWRSAARASVADGASGCASVYLPPVVSCAADLCPTCRCVAVLTWLASTLARQSL